MYNGASIIPIPSKMHTPTYPSPPMDFLLGVLVSVYTVASRRPYTSESGGVFPSEHLFHLSI